MSNISLQKGITFVTLLSIVLQSFMPFPQAGADAANAINRSGINIPVIEPSHYQPPVFEHPEPRIERQWNTSLSQEDLRIKSINQNDTISVGDWILNGNADVTTVPDAIKLTNDSYSQRGSAWFPEQIDLREDFELIFFGYFGARGEPIGGVPGDTTGGDGIAFVLQNTGTNVLGTGGSALGYGGISPSLVVEFDTFYNAANNEPICMIGSKNHIALMRNGNPIHSSSLPGSCHWNLESDSDRRFRIVWNASTKTISAFFGGGTGPEGETLKFSYTEDIVQTMFQGNPMVWYGFTGATSSISRNLQYFYPAQTLVSDRATHSSNLGMDGNISCVAICSQTHKGGPINTRTGGYDYSKTDIAIQTGAGEISFGRTYSSLAWNVYTTKLGYGWTHNHDLYLSIGEYNPNNNLRTISLKGHTANQYIYTQQNGFTSTTAEPGAYATLVQGPSSFILTDKAQNIYEFNLTTGRLIFHTSPTGQKILYTFDSKGRLTKISDQSGQRYLTLAYSGNGTKIVRVTDHTGRRISYEYDANNNLTQVTDTLGQIWNYVYDASHRITYVYGLFGQTSQVIERTEYDAQGRAVRQYDGENNLVVELIYNADGTTTVKDAQNNTETHTYDFRKTLTNQTDPMGGTTSTTYDSNFRPATITDANGNTTSLVWGANGADLLQLTDPLNGQVSLGYDSNHNLTSIVDQNNYLTTYAYSGTNLTGMTDALNSTWTYTYTPQGYLASQTDPLGRTTSYTYNAQGQRLSMTDPLNKTWTYAYDNLGRLITTTDPLGRVTRNEYDAADQLIKVTRNYNASYGQNHQNQWNIVTQYQYDTRGNQTAMTDTYGRTTTYQYDAAGRLIRTTDVAGKTTINAYNSKGQLISVTDPLGRTTRYQYDATGRVIAVTDALNKTTSTTYNLDGTVATTKDALNRVTSYTYDELKRIETITDPMGGVTSYAYDAAGNMTSVTDPRGGTTTLEYDALGRVIRQTAPNGGITESFYDAAGNRIQTIDPMGNATTFAYDNANRLLTVTDARGGVTSYAYDDAGRRISMTDAKDHTSTYTYDVLDRVVSVTDPLGNTTQTQYDALGNAASQTDANNNTTTFQYDTLYRLVTQTNALNGATQFTYDDAGNRLTVKDPNNHTMTTVYDALNRPISFVDANGNSNGTTYDAVGNVISTTDGLNHATTFGYDANNRQISVADALRNVTQYGYNAAGDRVSMTDANGVVTRFEYNNMGWLTAVVENYKAGVQPDQETNVRTEYTYDLNGNRLTVRDGRGNVSTFIYDELNRLVQESDPLGNTWTYYYDAVGNQTSIVDANGATTQFTYDAANRLVGIDYPGGTPDVTFAYDTGGRRIGMTDGAGSTTWTYDALNRVTAVQDPFGSAVGYGYDAAGNRISLTYPSGSMVNYTYDAGNRLTTVNGLSSVVNYTYDGADRLTGVSRPNGVSTTYNYDNANRLLALAHTLGGQNLALYQYMHDAVGNRTQAIEDLAFPEGALPTATPTATFTETPTVTPTGTETFTPSPTDTDTEPPTGTMTPTPTETIPPTATSTDTPLPTDTPEPTFTPMETPTETPTQVSFYGGNYLASYLLAPKTKTPTPPGATPTPTWTPTFTFTPTSSGPTDTPTFTPTATVTTTPFPPPVLQSVTIDYTYDALYRLTAADYSDGKYYHYAYDEVGNRLTASDQLSVTSYQYDIANRLTSVNSTTYTWDNSGNLLDDGTNTYAYDSANRLTSVNGTTTYTYNGLGDRLTQNAVQYTLDLNAGLTQVLSDGTNTYLYGLGRLAERAGGINEFYLGDALGSVRQLTNNYGEVVLTKSYDPYGNNLQSLGTGETVFGFTGETVDGNGLLYLRARYYSSQQGRFFQKDPWSGDPNLPATLNPYLYGLNNPVLYTDPSGENPLAFVLALAGVIGLGAVAGGVYGCISYEWAIAGQCGCDMQQAATSMSKADWVSMHALLGGFTAGVLSLATAAAATWPAAAVIVGGASIGFAVWDGVNLLNVVYDEGVGWTRCTVTRAAMDLALAIFGTTNLVSGLRAWRASGSWLKWAESGLGVRPGVIRAFTKDIRYTQSAVNPAGRIEGGGIYTIESNVAQLKSNPNFDLPPIRIFKMESYMRNWGTMQNPTNPQYIGNPKNLQVGKIYTLDNRRLLTYRLAGRNTIPARWADPMEVFNWRFEFTTKDFGLTIEVLPMK
jgi:RHS repeat-associated protein